MLDGEELQRIYEDIQQLEQREQLERTGPAHQDMLRLERLYLELSRIVKVRTLRECNLDLQLKSARGALLELHKVARAHGPGRAREPNTNWADVELLINQTLRGIDTYYESEKAAQRD